VDVPFYRNFFKYILVNHVYLGEVLARMVCEIGGRMVR